MNSAIGKGLWVVVALVTLGGAAVGAWVFGRPRVDDVGQHAALAPVLARLAGLPACGIRYRMHRRDSSEQVLLDQCEPITSYPTPGRVAVSQDYPLGTVAFQAKRASAREPWQVVVDKDHVPLDRLVAAFDALAPLLQREAAAEIAKARGIDEDAVKRARTHAEDEERARERSRSSYEK